MHEAQMHEQNSFITLTYDDEHLGDNKLHYSDFQRFMKDLRQELDYAGIQHQIGFIAVGEYGAKTKRKHWHACLFGWSPEIHPTFKDFTPKYKYTTELGHKVYTSPFLQELWPYGASEYGTVTLQSASYVARYSAKKLVHGNDQDHELHPIFKASSKYAIGRKFLEKYYDSIFNLGAIALENGETCAIPRYYEKWLKKHQPERWEKYVTGSKAETISRANGKNEIERNRQRQTNLLRPGLKGPERTRLQAKARIIYQRFANLQKNHKF